MESRTTGWQRRSRFSSEREGGRERERERERGREGEQARREQKENERTPSQALVPRPGKELSLLMELACNPIRMIRPISPPPLRHPSWETQKAAGTEILGSGHLSGSPQSVAALRLYSICEQILGWGLSGNGEEEAGAAPLCRQPSSVRSLWAEDPCLTPCGEQMS